MTPLPRLDWQGRRPKQIVRPLPQAAQSGATTEPLRYALAVLDQAAEVTLTSRPGGVSVRWRLAAALTDDERAGAMAVIVAHAGWMSGKLPMHGEVVEIVLRTGRVPQDVVSGMAEQPFGNLQHTVRLTPASTLEIPRPASELLSQLSI